MFVTHKILKANAEEDHKKKDPACKIEGLLRGSLVSSGLANRYSKESYETVVKKIENFTECKDKYQKKEIDLEGLQSFLIKNTDYKLKEGLLDALETLSDIKDDESNRKNLEMALENSLKVLEMNANILKNIQIIAEDSYKTANEKYSSFMDLRTELKKCKKNTDEYENVLENAMKKRKLIDDHRILINSNLPEIEEIQDSKKEVQEPKLKKIVKLLQSSIKIGNLQTKKGESI